MKLQRSDGGWYSSGEAVVREVDELELRGFGAEVRRNVAREGVVGEVEETEGGGEVAGDFSSEEVAGEVKDLEVGEV